jgi:acyl carrier protein
LRDLEQELRAFLTDNFIITSDTIEMAGNESLTRRGIVDSVGVLELILFLENNYGIDIPDHEVISSNMDTIDSIVSYVSRKLGLSSPAEVAGGSVDQVL